MLAASPLIDIGWYVRRYSDVAGSGLSPLEHFIRIGLPENRSAHYLFDASYYYRQNPDVARAGMPAIAHFIKHGGTERRDFHPLFDSRFYAAQFADEEIAGRNLLLHFLENRDVRLSPTPLFDAGYYLAMQPDVQAAGIRAFDHYVRFGDSEGRNPHPAFDVGYVRAQLPDQTFGITALQSFVEDERRYLSPHPLFDAQWYADQVEAGEEKPWVHCVTAEGQSRISPHPLFSPSFYLDRYPDIGVAGVSPFLHYLTAGATERRDPHPWFDTRYYLDRFHQGGRGIANPLIAYLIHPDGIEVAPHPDISPDWYSDRNRDLMRTGVAQEASSSRAMGGAPNHLPATAPPEIGTTRAERYDPLPSGASDREWLDDFMDGIGNDLFDEDWYRRQFGRSLPDGVSARDHFISHGFAAGISPSPIIDADYAVGKVAPSASPLLRRLMEVRAGGAPHPLIDLDWYVQRYPDVAGSGLSPLEHFLRIGLPENRSPHYLFDASYYYRQNPDVARADIPAIVHFIKHGDIERRDFHPLFDHRFYASRFPEAETAGRNLLAHFLASMDIRLSPTSLFDADYYLAMQPDVWSTGLRAFDHYLRVGDGQGHNPHPAFDIDYVRAELPASEFGTSTLQSFVEDERNYLSPHPLFDARWYAGNLEPGELGALKPWIHCAATDGHSRISPHPLFSPRFYLDRYPDIRAAGVSPYFHYLMAGAGERRDPHPWFDTRYYLNRYHEGGADVADPLLAYLAHSNVDRIAPHPLFDPDWYSYQNHDRDGAYRGLLHLIVKGDRQGYSPHPLFDHGFYCGNDPAILDLGGASHFLEFGWREDRNPHPMFDLKHYRTLNRATLPADVNPLVHYLKSDRAQRRHPHPLFDGVAHSAASALCQDTAIDPLVDYIQFRSNLDPTLVHQRRTAIPKPRKAVLPARRTVSSSEMAEPYLISVLLPVYNSPEKYLVRCVESILNQRYRRLELIIVDDGSSTADFPEFLQKLAATDDRIRLKIADRNGGISRATNQALEMAKGEYVALVDHDDVLLSTALSSVVAKLDASQADGCYTDQAYVTAWDTFDGDFHKPSWSPAMLSGVMYVGHLLVVRTRLARDLGGFDSRFDRVQDFEFMLRFGELSSKIAHVPEILYQWRRIPGSIAHEGSSKGRIEELQASAVNAHFARTGFRGEAEPHASLAHRLRILPGAEQVFPAYDLIVLDAGGGQTVPTAVRDAAASIVVLETGQAALTIIDKIKSAIARGTAPHILIVDAEARWNVEDRLSDALAMYCEQDDVLAAAPHLFDEIERCVAAGSILDKQSGIRPAMTGQTRGFDGYAGSLSCTREVTALHAAVLMLNRARYDELGGLDAQYLDPYFAFADLELRARERGLRNIAVAHPPVTFDPADVVRRTSLTDVYVFKDKHGTSIAGGDPYYNSAFDPNGAYVRGV